MKRLLLILFIIQGTAFGSSRFNNFIDGSDLPLTLERHERIFFTTGSLNSKLQFSFKVPVVLESDFYFAYTGTGFWRLYQEDSSPFQDINHNPELFYRWRIHEKHGLDLGVEHLSNGQNEIKSRSWNDFYVQTMSKLDKNFYLTSKAFYLWDEDYRIKIFFNTLIFRIELGVKEVVRSKFQSNEFFIGWRPGSQFTLSGGYHTFEVGLKLKFSEMKYFQHFFLTYYNGFAENQIYYDKYTRAFRIGLTF